MHRPARLAALIFLQQLRSHEHSFCCSSNMIFNKQCLLEPSPLAALLPACRHVGSCWPCHMLQQESHACHM